MARNPNRLPFELDPNLDESLITAHAGLPLVVEMFRATGAAAKTDELLRHKKKALGLTPSEMLESVFALWTSGGDRCEDFESFRTDRALVELIRHELPAPQTARDFFDTFHPKNLKPIWEGDSCVVYEESMRLEALAEVNRTVIDHVQSRKIETEATIDVDAVVIECDRKEAEWTYKKTKGYQPVVALWAEQDLILVDEYRDGNVPAGSGNRRVIEKAVAQLPTWVNRRLLRGDSACYEKDVLAYLEKTGVEYAISADVTRELLSDISRMDEAAWTTDRDEGECLRQYAEVIYVPEEKGYKSRNDSCPTRRYLVIRVIKKQGYFFADGSDRKHFAVVTNRTGDPLELIEWHRKKAGTIEHVHHVVVNEFAGGAIPSKKFGAKAAWFRANTILYNLISAPKRLTLPEEYRTARPKRLRFLLFNTVGRVVSHAREVLLRFAIELTQRLFDISRVRIHLKHAT